MQRDPNSFYLTNVDRCVMCGQTFIYVDIPNNKLSYITDEVLTDYWKEQRIKKLNRINGN